MVLFPIYSYLVYLLFLYNLKLLRERVLLTVERENRSSSSCKTYLCFDGVSWIRPKCSFWKTMCQRQVCFDFLALWHCTAKGEPVSSSVQRSCYPQHLCLLKSCTNCIIEDLFLYYRISMSINYDHDCLGFSFCVKQKVVFVCGVSIITRIRLLMCVEIWYE